MDFLSTDIATTPLAKVLEAAWQSRNPFRSAGLHRLNDSVKSATGSRHARCVLALHTTFEDTLFLDFKDLNPVTKCITPLCLT